MDKKEQEFKKKLTKEQYHVLREKGTERPYSGKYLEHHEDGTYTCAACGHKIFSSEDKYDSGSGWPSFKRAMPGAVETREDKSHFMTRTEVVCPKCGSHLGHVFDIGKKKEDEQYFCINSVALDFKKK